MGSYKGRFMSLALAAVLGAGLVACDRSSADETDGEASVDDQDDAVAIAEPLSDEELEGLPFYATGPIAQIDGEDVSEHNFNHMVHEQVQRLPMEVQPQMVEMFKTEAVEAVISQHLIEKRLADADIEVTDEDVEETMDEFKSQFGGDEELFKQQLAQFNMDEDQLREEMHEHVHLEKFLEAEYDLAVEDDEVEAFYEENGEAMAPPPQVQARHILIKAGPDADESTQAEARERAMEIYEEASADGADFEELAREKSEGPSAGEGGNLGFFSHGDMLPEFSNAAFEMEAGDISEPVQTQHGYHIIQVVDTREGGDGDLESLRPRIEMTLKQQKFQRIYQEFVEELKSEVEIERLEDNITMNIEPAEAPQQGMPQMPQGGGGGQGQQGQQPQIQLPESGDEESGGQELQLDQDEVELQLDQ